MKLGLKVSGLETFEGNPLRVFEGEGQGAVETRSLLR
jgi:hypothetical protein